MGQLENGFVQPLGAGLPLSQAVPRSSTVGNYGGDGSGVLGGADDMRNLLLSLPRLLKPEIPL